MALQEQYGHGSGARDIPEIVQPLGRPTPSGSSLRGLVRAALVVDVLMMMVAIAAGYVAWSGRSPWIAGVGLLALWLVSLAARGAYDPRRIGVGSDEFKNVFSATVVLFSLAASLAYVLTLDVERPFLVAAFLSGLVALPLGRRMLRVWVFAKRRKGDFLQKSLVVGDGQRCRDLTERLDADPRAGFEVIATIPGPERSKGGLDRWLDQVERLVRVADIDAVAVTQTPSIDSEVIRRLSWRLEMPNVDLLVASAMGDLTGPRLSIRPAAGLPLLHLDEPRLAGPQAIIKRGFDIIVSAILLVVLSPVLLATAAAIALTSRGPILFVQERVGKGGRLYRLVKFRSMVDGADEKHDEVLGLCATPDQYEKDSRITPLGRFLRRWSIDELPQLFNVVRGQMSLVGPRPMLVSELPLLGDADHRRHVTKPGMTGLWQVAGRKEVPWDERMQMDLRYVESWSLALDLVIIAKTFKAVATGRGAH